jgi:hypothetical protein
VRSDARVGVVDTVVDGDEGKGLEVDEDGSVRSDERGDVVLDKEVVAKGVTVDTVVDGDKGNGIEVGSVPVTVRSDARVGVVDTVVDGDEGKGMEVDEDGSVPVDTLVDGDEGKKDMGVNVDVSENQTSVNACTFSSADDIKIYQIGKNIRNKFVITSAAGMRFQASVLSLYVHALRVHFIIEDILRQERFILIWPRRRHIKSTKTTSFYSIKAIWISTFLKTNTNSKIILVLKR